MYLSNEKKECFVKMRRKNEEGNENSRQFPKVWHRVPFLEFAKQWDSLSTKVQNFHFFSNKVSYLNVCCYKY